MNLKVSQLARSLCKHHFWEHAGLSLDKENLHESSSGISITSLEAGIELVSLKVNCVIRVLYLAPLQKTTH